LTKDEQKDKTNKYEHSEKNLFVAFGKEDTLSTDQGVYLQDLKKYGTVSKTQPVLTVNCDG